MSDQQQPARKGNDLAYWLLIIVLGYLAWPSVRPEHVNAQPIATPAPVLQFIQPAPPSQPVTDDCAAAVHSVPPGWAEGLGGPEPACWAVWSEAQRLEFMNWVRVKAKR